MFCLCRQPNTRKYLRSGEHKQYLCSFDRLASGCYEKAFQFVLDTPKCYWEVAKRSAANWRHGSFTPTVVLTEPPSLPATVLSRSDCDWTGVPLFSLWVMAKSGAARYFESAFIALCLSAGHGVPLHTLMLITITKRKYLANGYSVFKEQSRFRHTKENRARVFCPLTL